MAQKLPYVNATNLVSTVLDKIIEAPTPPKFTLDFIHHKLGIKTSSVRAIPPLLIKLGFLSTDRIPTETYNEFRNSNKSPAIMAEAIREAYKELYECSEYAHTLSDNDLKSYIIQITGLERNNRTVNAICGTFKALREYADFDSDTHNIPNISDVNAYDSQLPLLKM